MTFLLAAADVPTWVGIPAGIAGLGIPLGLWLSGRIMLRSDCNEKVDAMTAAHTGRLTAVTERLDAVIAERSKAQTERDAWHEAWEEETRARQAAERSAAALLDQTRLGQTQSDTTKQLLELIMTTVRTRDPGERHERRKGDADG